MNERLRFVNKTGKTLFYTKAELKDLISKMNDTSILEIPDLNSDQCYFLEDDMVLIN